MIKLPGKIFNHYLKFSLFCGPAVIQPNVLYIVCLYCKFNSLLFSCRKKNFFKCPESSESKRISGLPVATIALASSVRSLSRDRRKFSGNECSTQLKDRASRLSTFILRLSQIAVADSSEIILSRICLLFSRIVLLSICSTLIPMDSRYLSCSQHDSR